MVGAVIESVEATVPWLGTLTLTGLIDAVKVVPGKYSESPTVPVKPCMLVTVMVDVDVAPSTSQIDDGFSEIRKEPGSLLEFA